MKHWQPGERAWKVMAWAMGIGVVIDVITVAWFVWWALSRVHH